MTMNIYIMQGKDYFSNQDNEVFQGTISSGQEFSKQSSAFKELTDLLGDNDHVKLHPKQYSPLIPKFEEETAVAESKRRRFLSGKGKLKSEESTDRNLGLIYGGICLLYSQLVKCKIGLERGKRLGKRLEISL